jgi:pimeloyl-ACP methyl ester carboxylesterase
MYPMADALLDHPLISSRYFFPRPCRFPEPFWVSCGDIRLGCYYHETDPAARTIIHFHGNGETVEDYLGDFVARITALGCNLLLAEYRGYGMSTGAPSLGLMLDDVACVILACGRPPEEVVLFGRSVGSLFAVHGVKLFPRIAGLIIESGIADPLERLLLRVTPPEMGVTPAEFRAAVTSEFDQRETLAAYPGPLLVLHTRNDGLVDVSHGERLHDWGGGPKSLRIFERGDHNNILLINEREYFAALATFIARLPAPARPEATGVKSKP